MVLTTPSEVKNWLYSFRSHEKDILLHIRHYEENRANFGAPYSNKQIANLQYELLILHRDMDNILSHIPDNIKPIFTARYIRRIGWDYINLYSYYSRRQAIRLHNKVLKLLVGIEVGTN